MGYDLFLLLSLLWPLPVLALAPCTYLPGGCPPVNVIATSTLPALGSLLVKAAAGLSVVFLILSGYKMLMSFGDETKISQGRMGVIYGMLGLSLAIASQIIVSFVVSEPQFGTVTAAAMGSAEEGVIAAITAVATFLIFLFNAIFLIVVVLAGMRMVIGRGQPEEFTRGRTMVAWAIGGAIIVNTAYALIKFVTSFFGV